MNPKVHLKIYFDGNISVKTNNLVNQSPTLANPVRWEFAVLRDQSDNAWPDPNNRPQLRRRPTNSCLDVLRAERGCSL